jgi:hypothetical protein
VQRLSLCILSWNFRCRDIGKNVNSSWIGFFGTLPLKIPLSVGYVNRFVNSAHRFFFFRLPPTTVCPYSGLVQTAITAGNVTPILTVFDSGLKNITNGMTCPALKELRPHSMAFCVLIS